MVGKRKGSNMKFLRLLLEAIADILDGITQSGYNKQ